MISIDMLSITNCSVVCCRLTNFEKTRRTRSTLYKGRKERSLLFENVHVAARKIAQQIKFKKCGRVNSSHVTCLFLDSLNGQSVLFYSR
jgi:hypothetical protein